MPLTTFQRDNTGKIKHTYQAGIFSEPRSALPLPGEMSQGDFLGSGKRLMANVMALRLYDERSPDTEHLKEKLAAHLTRGAYNDFYVEEHFVHGHTDFRLTFLDAGQAKRFVAAWDGMFEENPAMTSRNAEIIGERGTMAAAERSLSGMYGKIVKGLGVVTNAAITGAVRPRANTAHPA